MKYTKWILILALALGACSNRNAPPPAAAPAGQASSPPNPALAAPPTSSASDSAPAPSLKPKYPDKTALLADVKAAKPTTAVELDGETVAPGFGPPMRYRTAKDGSVSR
ncbi:MAG TPA: hypothetical protein VLQ46_04175 [Casimicrobiaceae bacterium]|nr:hypothetical protein [Casimicrobiaceae bacterium]